MSGKSILVIGDSWADCLWPSLLGIPESHRQAVSGSTAAQWASDFDGRLTKAASTPADVLIVSLMGNDLRDAMRDGVVTEVEIQAARDAMRCVCATARKARNIAMLYSVPDFAGLVEIETCIGLNRAVIRAIPSGFHVCASETFLSDQHFLPDGIHTNHAGQFLIANHLEAMLP